MERSNVVELHAPSPSAEYLEAIAREVAEDLKWAGIDRVVAVRLAQDVIAFAQQANLAAGGNGSGQQTGALLIAAFRMLGAMVSDGKLVATYGQIAAALSKLSAATTAQA